MIVESLFDFVSYRLNDKPHIVLDASRCQACEDHACTSACPARCYEWSVARARLEFAYEACLECGTCLAICTPGALDWHYPEGGFGVRFPR